jgi:hypothetical protein
MPSRSASARAYVALPEPELPKTRTLIIWGWLTGRWAAVMLNKDRLSGNERYRPGTGPM